MLNEFKSKLENGEFVYGVFVKTSDPMFNEIIVTILKPIE